MRPTRVVMTTPRKGGIGGSQTASRFKFGVIQMVAAAALLTGLAALTLAFKLTGPDLPSRVRLPTVFEPGTDAMIEQQQQRLMSHVEEAWLRQGDKGSSNPAFRAAKPGALPKPSPRRRAPLAASAGQRTSPASEYPPGANVPEEGEDPREYRFAVVPSPSYSPIPEVYHLRECTCEMEGWKEASRQGKSVCTCGGTKCPSNVTPQYLTDAWGQDNCSVKRATGFLCSAKCTEDGKIFWYAEGCGARGQKPCIKPIIEPSATPSQTGSAKPTIVVPRTTWDPNEVYDFRGGGCELLNGKKQCYMEDGQGRELCPDHVTLEYLTQGPPEYPECRPERSHQKYCTIICQENNPVVRWGVHDIEDCHTAKNLGNCPPRPKVVPKKDFVWKEWTEKKRPETRCEAAARLGGKGEMLSELSVGLLTHEPRSFAESMASYEKNGLFDVVPEFIIFINNRREAVEKVAEEYQQKYPGKIKVLGSAENQGITRGMLALTAAATKPYFLFLERDFFLIEPQTCVYEELKAGIDLIKANAAHVIRYRHKWRAGRPNWAYRFFAGHEEDGFRGWQPNLGCNVHYWLEDPVKSFPQYFWTCGEKPDMVCSDSYYCNWTNNPQLWAIDWWNREYVEGSFKHPVRLDPYDNLESWFNWDPNAWNERRFVIAQGMGLFKHRDLGNIVHV